MNCLQRLAAAVRFQPTDRVPVVPQIFGHAARFCDVALVDYIQHGETLAACQIRARQHYRHDALFAFMDACVESEAMGAGITFRQEDYPDVATFIGNRDTDIRSLEIPLPSKAGRMPELLKAATLLREHGGDTIPVIGCVLGPMTLASQLFSLETALFLAIDETERFEALLDFCAGVAISFGTAQIKAGVHLPFIFDPASSPEMVPPQFFKELLAPRLKRIFSAFRQVGSLAGWLHIAGRTETILPHYPDIGVEIANFDYCVDAQKAQELLPTVCLDGNLRPYDFTKEEPGAIVDNASRLLGQFSDRGGFILSSGCEIPVEARPRTIAAMIDCVAKDNQPCRC